MKSDCGTIRDEDTNAEGNVIGYFYPAHLSHHHYCCCHKSLLPLPTTVTSCSNQNYFHTVLLSLLLPLPTSLSILPLLTVPATISTIYSVSCYFLSPVKITTSTSKVTAISKNKNNHNSQDYNNGNKKACRSWHEIYPSELCPRRCTIHKYHVHVHLCCACIFRLWSFHYHQKI